MRHISGAIQSLALAFAVSMLFTAHSIAQSFPAGQVTYRAQVHSPVTGQNFEAFVRSVSGNSTASAKSGRCRYDTANPNNKSAYTYATWFPTLGTGCLSPIILSYFGVEKSAVGSNAVQYLYNAQQSTSQVNADLFTATFPLGFQAVLAGTATAGSSQTTPTTSSMSSSTSSTAVQTDSVATAVSKIESGGDFNLRFPFPVVSHFGQGYALDGRILPNIGFNINKFGAQDTITQSSEYTFNIPFELYGQTTSIDPSNPAIVFIDLKPSGEIISSALAQSIGLTGSRAFFLGEGSVGVEFAQRIRVSLQYFVGPHQIYQTVSPTGTTTTATHIGGFHLAVSFAPLKPGK